MPERPEGELDGVELRPYLSNLCVDAARRKKGIGRRLVEACEEEARQWDGCTHEAVWLEVSMSNTGAFAFYQRMGYEQTTVTQGREVVKQRWSFNSQKVQRRLLRKPLRREAQAGASQHGVKAC